MSLKQELEIYVKAVAAYDAEDYDLAVANFEVDESMPRNRSLTITRAFQSQAKFNSI